MAATTVVGNTIADSYLISGATIRSRAVLTYELISETNTYVTYRLTCTLQMATSVRLTNSSWTVGFLLRIGDASQHYDQRGTVVAVAIPVGTTPTDLPSSSSFVITKDFRFGKEHAAATHSIAAMVQTGHWLDTPTASEAHASPTIPVKTSYQVSYNANNGTGAPGAQTKWYDETLTPSTTKPTRTGYTFQGWSKTSGGNVAYASEQKYTANAAATLYAVWKAANAPMITGVSCERCLSDGTLDDEGTYAKIEATYSVDKSGNSANKVTTAVATLGSVSNTTTVNAASGTYSKVLGTFAAASTYTGTVVFTDANGRSTTVGMRLAPASYPIDVLFNETEHAYSVGVLMPAASTGCLSVGGDINSLGEWIYFGNGTDAGLYTHTTGRNGRVMVVKGVDGYGASIELGAGGLTIVGGGESAASLYSEYVTNGTVSGGDEQLWLGADSEVDIFTKCNSVTNGIIDGEHKFRFTTTGNIITGGAVFFGNTDDPDSGTHRAGINATDGAIYLTAYNTSSGVKAQFCILNATGKIGTRVYDGSAWGSWNYLDPSSIVVGADIVLYPTNNLMRFVLTSGGNFRFNKRSSESVDWSDSSVEHFYAPMGKASTASHTANTVYAAPNGASGAANFRALVANDLPTVPTTKVSVTNFGVTGAGSTNGVPASYIAAASTKYTSAGTAGWSMEKFAASGGFYLYHAHGVVRIQNTACTTAFGNGYINAANIYIRLPHVARMIQSVTYGSSQGGAWLGMSLFSAGTNTDWCSNADNIYNLPVRMFSPASRAASTSATEGVYFIPVDVWFSSAS